jgi:hypothetical protein
VAVLGYILQIAFFGAAGTSFIAAHLKNMAARDIAAGRPPSERWRVFRHPHKAHREPEGVAALRGAAVLHTAWGFAFLGGAAFAPAIFRLLGVGA